MPHTPASAEIECRRSRPWPLFLLVCVFVLPHHQAPQSTSSLVDSAATIAEYVALHLDLFATPEYLSWKGELRAFQRRHYASMLFHVRNNDGMAAVLDFVRLHLQSEFARRHSPIYLMTDRRMLFPLPQDWSFPVDPWGNEQ